MIEQYTLCPPIPGPFAKRPEWLPEGQAFRCRISECRAWWNGGDMTTWPAVHSIRLPDSAFGEEFWGESGKVLGRPGLCCGKWGLAWSCCNDARTYRLLRDDPFYQSAAFQRLRVKPANPGVNMIWPEAEAIYKHIEHSDQEHRDWLAKALDEFFTAKNVFDPVDPSLTYAEWVAMKPTDAPDGVVLPKPVPAWMQEIAERLTAGWFDDPHTKENQRSIVKALQLAVREGHLHERKA